MTYQKLVNTKIQKFYKIDRGVPSPYIVYDNSLYIPNTYNIFTTVEDLTNVKFKKYNLED